MNAQARIGISGWRYEPWRGVFYPNGLLQKKELYFASRQMNSIEINGTFYSFQSPKSFRSWHDETPGDFVYSVKGPRYITHIRRLNDVKIPLANFFASGVLHLIPKLGAFLWQLPPNFLFYEDRLEEFFRHLPKTATEASVLAKKSDRGHFEPPRVKTQFPIRHAVEIRHHSFENPDFISLLRKYEIALVIADTAGRWPYMEDITADFLYLRLHGDSEIYKSGYTENSLQFWADRLRQWSQGRIPTDSLTISETQPKKKKKRDFFVYFDNDQKVRAPFDAIRLSEILNVNSHQFHIRTTNFPQADFLEWKKIS